MSADAHLAAEHHVVFDVRAAGDSDLRRHQHVAADGDAVPDLHEVVDLRAAADARLPDRRTIHGGVRAELDVVFDHHGSDLRDLLVRPVAAADEAVAVAADDHAVLQDDAIADGDALAERHVGVDHAVGADPGARADRHVREDDGVVADRRALPDRHERADRDAVADARIAGDRRQRVHAGRRAPGGREQADGAREGQVRIGGPQHRARRRRRVLLEQDGGGARLGHRRFVLRIGEKGQVARLSVLNACDADDLHLAVALEAAGEPFSELA